MKRKPVRLGAPPLQPAEFGGNERVAAFEEIKAKLERLKRFFKS
ncbi:hypothetical protein B4113_1375 [Geobacillus sp. B4113_201601]|nr:hypothetical protein B4113_1375 [Geobacillus sp. B4113_201601]